MWKKSLSRKTSENEKWFSYERGNSPSLTFMYECHSNSFLFPRKKNLSTTAFQHFPANLQIFSTFILDLKNKLMYFCGQISLGEEKSEEKWFIVLLPLLLFLFAHKKQIKSSPICFNWMSFFSSLSLFLLHAFSYREKLKGEREN